MLRRLRSGEWIAVGGLVGLVASLFLSWFTVTIDLQCQLPENTGDGASSSWCPYISDDFFGAGWGALGRPWADFLVLAALAVVIALAMALRSGPRRPTYGAVVSLIVAGAATALVTLLTAIRVLLARPGVELAATDDELGLTDLVSTGIGPGGWIGLASLIVLLMGLWVAVADDRTDAPDSVFDPPEPRPVPDGVAGPGPSAPDASPAPPAEA